MKTYETILAELQAVYAGMLAAEVAKKEEIAGVMPRYTNSATNLVDYLAVRPQNMEALQKSCTGWAYHQWLAAKAI